MRFNYEVISHSKHDEVFAKVQLHLIGHSSKDTHPESWDYELLVPIKELKDWQLGSYIGIELHLPTPSNKKEQS